MSIEKTGKVIKAFLQNSNSEALAIKGSWGVGKTFFWNKLIKNIDKDECSFERYAYVSLFGIKSLDEFKFAIVSKLVDKSIAGKNLTLKDFVKETKSKSSLSIDKAGGLFLKKVSPIINKLFSKSSEAIIAFTFDILEDTLICIDDFDRKSESLEPEDILGIVSKLKEEQNCKVVMIFNDNALDDGDRDKYDLLREKVVDIEINYSPTTSEIYNIAFNDGSEINESIISRASRLGINNIRILKKIKGLSEKANELIKNEVKQEVIQQAINTIVLLTWCFYAKDKNIPKYEFIKNNQFKFFASSNYRSEEDQNWDSIIRDYGYTDTDEFDLILANGIEAGYFDEESLIEKAQILNKSVIAQKGQDSFKATWGLFHNSFKDNADEIVSKFKECFEANANHLSIINLDHTVSFLRELRKDKDADELIEFYIKKNKHTPNLFNLSENDSVFAVKDKEISKRFHKVFLENIKKPQLGEILKKISDSDNWSELDIEVLASKSKNDFYEYFISQDDEDLYQYVKKCLDFRNYQNTENPKKEFNVIVKNVTNALKMIGKINKLNEIRVQQFNIK